MALLICLIFSTRARAARGKNKNMIRPLARIFLTWLLVLYHSCENKINYYIARRVLQTNS
jgi:hypothetical protein